MPFGHFGGVSIWIDVLTPHSAFPPDHSNRVLMFWDSCENRKTVGIKGRTYPVDNNSLFQRFMK